MCNVFTIVYCILAVLVSENNNWKFNIFHIAQENIVKLCSWRLKIIPKYCGPQIAIIFIKYFKDVNPLWNLNIYTKYTQILRYYICMFLYIIIKSLRHSCANLLTNNVAGINMFYSRFCPKFILTLCTIISRNFVLETFLQLYNYIKISVGKINEMMQGNEYCLIGERV